MLGLSLLGLTLLGLSLLGLSLLGLSLLGLSLFGLSLWCQVFDEATRPASFCLPRVSLDKHRNLALVDVDERCVRKRFPKTSMFDVDLITKKLEILDVRTSDRKKKTKKVVKKEVVTSYVICGHRPKNYSSCCFCCSCPFV